MVREKLTVTVQEPCVDIDPRSSPLDLFARASRDITITGRRNCETLRALIEAGPRGTSSLEHWVVGKRLSHYVFRLRGFGLNIETQDVQTGDGVRYGRYVLHGDVEIIDGNRLGDDIDVLDGRAA